MEEIRDMLRVFAAERDWEKFHTPENLAKSVAIEAGELLECFQWSGEYDTEALSDEIADVMCYCIMLADKAGLDMEKEIRRKIAKNAEKYPAEICRGKSDKYTQLEAYRNAGKKDV